MWIFKTMRGYVRIMSVVALITITGGHGVAEDDFDAFFNDFREKRDGIGALRAAFVQRTLLPDEVVTTEGVVYYSKPRRILFKTRSPETAIMVDGRRGYEYDAEIRQVTIFNIENNPRADIFFMGFDEDTETLRRAYDVSLMIVEDPRGRKGIKITPRADSEEEAYFMEVNLYLRDEDYLPYRIHIVNDAESQLFLDIEEIETSDKPDPEQARIFVPEGVVVILDDRILDRVGADGMYLPEPELAPVIEERELPPMTPLSSDPDGEESNAPQQ